jgi:hypothetical protein
MALLSASAGTPVVRLIVEVKTRSPELRWLSWLQLFIDDLNCGEKRTLQVTPSGR